MLYRGVIGERFGTFSFSYQQQKQQHKRDTTNINQRHMSVTKDDNGGRGRQLITLQNFQRPEGEQRILTTCSLSQLEASENETKEQNERKSPNHSDAAPRVTDKKAEKNREHPRHIPDHLLQ